MDQGHEISSGTNTLYQNFEMKRCGIVRES